MIDFFRRWSVFLCINFVWFMLMACGSSDPSQENGDGDLENFQENEAADENGEEEELEEVTPRHYYARDGALWTGDGNYLYLRGVNISNLAKYADDYLYDLTEDDVRILQESGVNSVRLLTFWNAIAPTEEGGFDTAYLDAYLDRVRLLTDAGIYVIVDMHQDLWGVPFQPHGAPDWACPEEIKEGFAWQSPWWENYISKQVSGCFTHFFENPALREAFASAWAAMARKVCDEPLVVGFDLINEPFALNGFGDRTFDNETLKPFYRNLMDAIEDVCPGRLYFWEHSAGYVLGISDPFDIPEEFSDRVVVSPHFYPVSVHEENEEGYVTPYEELESELLNLFQAYIDRGTPLWMGEYGGMTTNAGFGEYMKQIHDFYLKTGMSSAQYGYERNDGGFAFIDTESQLKDVFKPVFLTPLPTELPAKPESVAADWDSCTSTTRFSCSIGKSIKVTMPSADATCTFDPSSRVADFTPETGLVSTLCTEDGPVTMTCTGAL